MKASADPVEMATGVRFYLTSSEGIGGAIKATPDSFRVDEVSRYPRPDSNGRFTVARVQSWDIEQNELLQRLAHALSIEPRSIGFAGTKDRRAVTSQLLSFPAPLEKVMSLRLSGVTVLEAYRSTDDLYLGHSYGNRFDITVSGIPLDREMILRRIDSVRSELNEAGGFPNYFGPQRFGEVRPVTHLVGKALVTGTVADAVEVYLTVNAAGELGDGSDARKSYASHHDPVRALKEFPHQLRFERVLLERLARGDTPNRAFQAFPRHLKTLFIHAYQSFLFNDLLSRRMEMGISISTPVDGDCLVRYGYDGQVGSLPVVEVGKDNVDAARALVDSGRAAVAGPLVGTATPSFSGIPGKLVEDVLESEGVERADFAIHDAPKLSSPGTYRTLMARLPFWFLKTPPDVTPEGFARFVVLLDKGVYATVLLREFMKDGRASKSET